jgi:hypothetical protein
MFLWTFLGLAVVVIAGVVTARALGGRREPKRPQISPADSPAVRGAEDALKTRYTRGETDRRSTCRARSS